MNFVLTYYNKCSLGVGPVFEYIKVAEVQQLLGLGIHPHDALGAHS